MTSHVLVPIDGEPSSRHALEFALSEHPEATIRALHVIGFVDSTRRLGTLGGDARERYLEAEDYAEQVLAEAQSLASDFDSGLEIETDVAFGPPPRVIPDYAAEHGVDHIVMGDHGMAGSRRMVLGSVAEMVVRRAAVPVTVVRENQDADR
ncbi:universal stress protein [Natronoglomus mannanivorans]|uniref:Universal stress protein n=1 Tax=Natronoglomus mannanivorans TaxID=2979990 RepID=A0AAP2YYV5_9EURY|nr:universal stress protein [Halobacteria archaeon AArc-xg1-1]